MKENSKIGIMQSEDRQRANQIRLKITELSLFIYFFRETFASLPKTFTYSGALMMCRGKFAVEIVYMGLFWAENNSDTY